MTDKFFDIAARHPEPLTTQVPIALWRRLYDLEWCRRLLVLTVLAAAWQTYSRWLDNALLFPSFTETLSALIDGLKSGVLVDRILTSLGVLLLGYAVGLGIAVALAIVAMSSKLGRDLQATLTAMFNPLPAIALLPVAMLWIGLGTGSLVFVLAHSVIWSFSLSVISGFDGVSPTLRMVGRNYGLNGIAYIWKILIPAAFPSLLTGLRLGWAFAWRTLIAAELVFGVSAGSGGLGWYIYENKNQLEIASVFAGLSSVIIIGLVVEYLIFRLIEAKTVRRWGMAT
ncbi:MAG: ABC transporter permease [Deltaproteobacteria bacterium]|nr:ABC transporter permease [Deltaproteobacteria bacterium]